MVASTGHLIHVPVTKQRKSHNPATTFPAFVQPPQASSAAVIPHLHASLHASTAISQAVLGLVSQKVGTPAARPGENRELGMSVAEANRRLSSLVASAWATGTLEDRQRLFRRFIAWTHLRGISPSPDNACLFVVATNVKLQGMFAYAKMMSAIFGHIGADNRPLKSLTSVLRGSGGATPMSQARPIPRETLMVWALGQSPLLRLTALVAWKTASRWGEVSFLPHHHFVLISDLEVIVDWHALPKGRRSNPYCRSKLAVVTGPMTLEIARLLRAAGEFSRLSPWTTEKLDREWAKDPKMRGFTGHSIKRGAVDHLLRAKAAGASFPTSLISRLAKHQNDADEPDLADTTIRYTSDSIALGRALRTAEVTRFL